MAGTQGLVPTAWSRVHEQWGATQLQSRFERQAKRWMTVRDYTAWLAVRAVGEAATRTGKGDFASLDAFIRGPDFAVRYKHRCDPQLFGDLAAAVRSEHHQWRIPTICIQAFVRRYGHRSQRMLDRSPRRRIDDV